MSAHVKINSTDSIYKGRVYELVKENITLPNQVTVDIEMIKHPGAAAIVALTEDDEVIMIRQYRHAVGDVIWEIPAGTLDPEESLPACAKRELEEETGYKAAWFRRIGEIVPVPGYSDERIHVFLATGLSVGQSRPDRDELLWVHKVPLDEAVDMIYEGEIHDAKTAYGLLKARRVLDSRK